MLLVLVKKGTAEITFETTTTITTAPFFATFPRGSSGGSFPVVTPLGSGAGEKKTQTLKWFGNYQIHFDLVPKKFVYLKLGFEHFRISRFTA